MELDNTVCLSVDQFSDTGVTYHKDEATVAKRLCCNVESEVSRPLQHRQRKDLNIFDEMLGLQVEGYW